MQENLHNEKQPTLHRHHKVSYSISLCLSTSLTNVWQRLCLVEAWGDTLWCIHNATGISFIWQPSWPEENAIALYTSYMPPYTKILPIWTCTSQCHMVETGCLPVDPAQHILGNRFEELDRSILHQQKCRHWTKTKMKLTLIKTVKIV